eukprot:GHVU01030462.1.p1 GENE.GHVU01030462.1~~GHVU01030462.1.p1  ORF type:complete len:239 (-),score=48.03 GHVU01030462.1:919-1635(-)
MCFCLCAADRRKRESPATPPKMATRTTTTKTGAFTLAEVPKTLRHQRSGNAGRRRQHLDEGPPAKRRCMRQPDSAPPSGEQDGNVEQALATEGDDVMGEQVPAEEVGQDPLAVEAVEGGGKQTQSLGRGAEWEGVGPETVIPPYDVGSDIAIENGDVDGIYLWASRAADATHSRGELFDLPHTFKVKKIPQLPAWEEQEDEVVRLGGGSPTIEEAARRAIYLDEHETTMQRFAHVKKG